ncbi:MAG: DUF6232 family protein [Granulosicoccaceae bacterium]
MNDNHLFYHEGADIVVTRHWFRMGRQSHAIHYLRRLTLEESSPPRKVAMIVFFIGLLLTIVQVIQIFRETLPQAIALLLLIACIVLMIVSSYIAFVQADKHKLTVDFNDGETVTLALPGKLAAKELHAALQQAMDNQADSRLASTRSMNQAHDSSKSVSHKAIVAELVKSPRNRR